MLDQVSTLLNSLFEKFDIRKIFVLVVAISLFSAIWIQSGIGSYIKADRDVALIERLQKLESEGIEKSQNLGPLYKEQVRQIQQLQTRSWNVTVNTSWVVNFLVSSSIWALITLMGLFMSFSQKETGAAITLFVAVVFIGAITWGTFVLGNSLLEAFPTFWGSALTFTLLQVLPVGLLIFWSKRLKSNQQKSTTA